MTATTITPVEVATHIVTDLKSDAGIVAAVNNAEQIKELNWMGDEFTYPGIRYQISLKESNNNGNCKGLEFDLMIHFLVFSNKTSSLECQTIMGLLGQRYTKKRLDAATFFTLELNTQYIPPIPIDKYEWRGEVTAFALLKRKA